MSSVRVPLSPRIASNHSLAALAIAAMPFIALAPAAHADEAADAEQRSTIVVTGHREPASNPNANPQAPYKVEKSANGKFTEPLRDTPRTITAIPKEVIEDMGATSFREVVRSTPGVTLGTGEGGNAFGDRIFIRGFEARNDVYIDGLRDPGVTSREIFAVEQIEIVKGPSGSFGGRGTTGGLVSLQSKRPDFLDDYLVAEGGVGTENYWRGTIDANYRLSDSVAVRVNGLYHTADTPGRDHVETERWGGTVALTAHLTDTLSVGADYYYMRLEGIPDFGHPFDVTTSRPYKVDRDNFYGVIGRDFLKNGADVASVRIEFEPTSYLSFNSITRYGKTYNHYLVAAPGAVCRVQRSGMVGNNPLTGTCPQNGTSVPTPPNQGLIPVAESEYTLNAGSQRRWAGNEYWANSTSATAEFDTGGIGHTLVLGGDYAYEKVIARQLNIAAFAEDSAGNPLPVPTAFVRNLLNPNPVLGFKIPVGPNRSLAPATTKVRSFGAYLIDTIKFSPQWSLTLGGRYDTYDMDFRNPTATNPAERQLSNRSDFLNWQVSLLYKPVEAMSLYASWATSSNPSGEQVDGSGTTYGGAASATINLEPERNEAWEAGAKYEMFGGKLLASAAVFQITKDNARENIGGNVFQTVGRLRSRGAEASITGTLADRIELFGGYTFLDAKITRTSPQNAANLGRRFANIPRHTAQLLANLLVNDRIKIGGQVFAQSKITGEGTTTLLKTPYIPGYVRFDAVAEFHPTDRLELRLNVLNLTDKRYYDAIYRSGSPFSYIAPGRSATLTAKMTF
ncbi:TonB-dependent receptor [Sphingobium sp. DEHP117]|uniref:TonB-dependent receptor n=1 Tax=Sphingobium sp. DEHP117 TaxID=2993436 RepID=UPI0027D6E42A|nr:TonB-dependent receptor [Sphingobium sp. DEHP117]MDQ4420760.1 TonB-dependent receptor [Sphingobium sp. DEHP117]